MNILELIRMWFEDNDPLYAGIMTPVMESTYSYNNPSGARCYCMTVEVSSKVYVDMYDDKDGYVNAFGPDGKTSLRVEDPEFFNKFKCFIDDNIETARGSIET